MATVKKGVLTGSPQWWKHFRPYVKRLFWKRERKASKQEAKQQTKEMTR